jgi:hypothetical protein
LHHVDFLKRRGYSVSALLVTYDLKKPGQDYTDLLKTIKSYPWARLSESSYAIRSDESPETVYAKLNPFLDANDFIYIINLRKPYTGFGPKDVNDWLDANLPY